MTQAPTRRRSGELLEAIRAAVLSELDERGYQGVTFEGVARRAGTSKPVLYRRFATRAEMVIDARITAGFATPPADFVGPLREDLLGMARGLVARIGPEGVRTFRGILGEVDDATVGRVADLALARAEEWLEDIVARAREAGELGASPLPPQVYEAIVALFRHEVFFVLGAGREPDFEGIVDEVIVPLLRARTGAGGS